MLRTSAMTSHLGIEKVMVTSLLLFSFDVFKGPMALFSGP